MPRLLRLLALVAALLFAVATSSSYARVGVAAACTTVAALVSADAALLPLGACAPSAPAEPGPSDPDDLEGHLHDAEVPIGRALEAGEPRCVGLVRVRTWVEHPPVAGPRSAARAPTQEHRERLLRPPNA